MSKMLNSRIFDRRAKTAPSQYPRLPFHALRCLQLISSLIVGGIMSYFMYHLTHDHWNTPWTFIWLMAASLFSIAALTCTIFLHTFTGLHPHLNLMINGFLTVLWALSWSLLTWYMRGTLRDRCDIKHWNEDVGIMVCRIYKSLFTFTLTGLVSTLAALFLDLYVWRVSSRRGMYRLPDLNNKDRPDAVRGPFTGRENRAYGSGGLAEPRESEAWEAPRLSVGSYAERASNSMDQPTTVGYAVPDQQFEYDTGYHGGATRL